MAFIKLHDFEQDSFMSMWTYRDNGDDGARNTVIRSGSCTVFSLAFIKLAFARPQFSHIVDEFRRNIETIVWSQAEGARAHLASGSGYDTVLAQLGLRRVGDFVDASALTHTIADGEAWIHVFTTAVAFHNQEETCHTIAHVRGGDQVYMFDPNYGLWSGPASEWNECVFELMSRGYNIATRSRFLRVTP